MLEKQGWQVFNRGENGRSVPQRKWEIDGAIQTIEPLSPDIVIVMLGSNDLLQEPDLSAENCVARMERFMRTLLEQNWPCKYLLIAPPPMISGAWVSKKELITASQRLGAYYKAVAKRLSIGFADAGKWDIALTFDGVHFSEAGHIAFARQLHKILAELSGDAV